MLYSRTALGRRRSGWNQGGGVSISSKDCLFPVSVMQLCGLVAWRGAIAFFFYIAFIDDGSLVLCLKGHVFEL